MGKFHRATVQLSDLKILETTDSLFARSVGFAEGVPKGQLDLLHCTALFVSEGKNNNHDFFLRQAVIASRHTPKLKFVDFQHKTKANESEYFRGEKIGICGHIYDSTLMLENGKEQILVDEKKILQKTENGKTVYTLDYPNVEKYTLHLLVAFVIYSFEFPGLAEEIKKSVSGESKLDLRVSMEVLFSDHKYRVGEISPLESFEDVRAGSQDYYKGDKIEAVLESLRVGKNPYQGKPVYRVIGGEMFFSGMGIVFFPANAYSEILSTEDMEEVVQRVCTPKRDKDGKVTMECVVSSVAKLQLAALSPIEKGLQDEMHAVLTKFSLEGKIPVADSEQNKSEELGIELQKILLLYSETDAQKKGILFVIGFPKDGGGSQVQSVLFNKSMWTMEEARKWLASHKFHAGKVDVTKNYYRFRQQDPGKFKRMRTVKANQEGLIELFGFLAGILKEEIDGFRSE